MARKKIQYTETDLHLYSVLWNLRHAHDLFSVKLERETKFGKAFSVFSRFDVCPSYGEVDITYLVVKAGIRKTLRGFAYVGGNGFSHSRHLMSTFMYLVREILVEHNWISETELYDQPISVYKFRAINFDKW
ncbi:TPA: hypothetical protein PXF07_001780 [Mannheimia haemolytica]|uniref:Uncharacterized protein n=4 Tax=Pasteurellaceae TaxID=712 RepID=A0A9Q6K877_HISSO|nr:MULTISPECIES: hypothetical protein [Pasteurellaceae]AWW59225.1 hypothetical protein C4O88_01335 [Pasteurellaceae bacterium 12591]AWW72680.1 hypothetical protein C4O86_13230 [Pasteurellaceae bacterium 12565]ACA31458.1 hypothetical protein HSM_1686 [Histophilus somni 2336]AET15225.1 hypothetical protein Pmu_02950 [Pasteurella multocida 36950]AGK02711.1 hypothetical protein MHH_c22700 [Mannheimia haemolytica M42548]